MRSSTRLDCRGLPLPCHADGVIIPSPPRSSWPEDRERTRKEEARREARRQKYHRPTYDSSCPDEHDASQVRSMPQADQPGKLLALDKPKALVEKFKILTLMRYSRP